MPVIEAYKALASGQVNFDVLTSAMSAVGVAVTLVATGAALVINVGPY